MSHCESKSATDSLSTYRPVARTEDLVITRNKDEVLVYDQQFHHIHHLDSTTSAVWNLCDGKRTATKIAATLGLSSVALQYALRLLADCRLLLSPLPLLLGRPLLLPQNAMARA